MKRSALLCLLLAGVAVAGGAYLGGAQHYWVEAQSATRAAPTLATEGFDLAYVTSFHALAVCYDGTAPIDGGLVFWYRSKKLAKWAPGPTYSNCTLPVTGPNAGVCNEQLVSNPYGRA